MVTVYINGEKEIYTSFNLIDNGDGTYYSAYYVDAPKLLAYLEGDKQ